MKKPWIVCALMGWGLFGLALMTPQQAPASSEKGAGSGGGAGGGGPALVNCVGDVNGDGLVNIDDLVLVITNWGSCPGCLTASQCDDSNPCTTDTCQNGVCVHTPIPNCTTCTTSAQCANAFPNAQGICQGGVCVLGPCAAGYANCNGLNTDGCEVYVLNNPQNCGSCGLICSFPNAQALCVNGQCTMGPCNVGYANCNLNPADGCEVNINTNVQNCGSCGLMCVVPNGTPVCINGTCAIGSCNFGFANCNGLVADGCEVNILTSTQNCGSCGTPCVLANAVGSSRVDLQACKLEYSIVSPK